MIKGDIVVPKGFKVETSGRELTISWRSPGLMWLGFGVLGLVMVGFSLGAGRPLQFWSNVLSLLLHPRDRSEFLGAAVLSLPGVLFAYFALVGFLNKTVVKVGRSKLEVKRGPLLPFFPRVLVSGYTQTNKRLDPARIEQLYIEEELRGSEDTGFHHTYGVYMVTKSDSHEELLTGLGKAEQALYLEQQIERFLGIEDRPVEGRGNVMMDTNDLLKQGIAALKAGQKAKAYRLLKKVTQQDKDNETAWLWMSGTVNTDRERIRCLREVLRINPDNSYARRGLEHLEAKAGATRPAKLKRRSLKKLFCLIGLHRGEWIRESPNKCTQIRICERCGTESRRIRHVGPLDWKYKSPYACAQIGICERCGTKVSKRTRHKWGPWGGGSGWSFPERSCYRCRITERDEPDWGTW